MVFVAAMSDNNARLIIPDIHHKVELAERIRGNHPGMPAIFLGDYFDDFDDTAADMEKTCKWLKSAVENRDDEFLLGNHCFAYLSYELGVRWGFCSGWTLGKQRVFHQYFPGDALLKPSAWILNCQSWLISHAGEIWGQTKCFKCYRARPNRLCRLFSTGSSA